MCKNKPYSIQNEVQGMSELVQSFVQRISDSWRESVEKILQTSHVLVESEQQLSDTEFLDMVDQLPISQSTISKLLMIGKNSHLPNKVQYLPPHWTTIYEISQMDEQQIDKGIVEGFINPSSTKKEIDKFHQFFDTNVIVRSNVVDVVESTLGSITIPNDFDVDRIDDLQNDIRRLELTYGVKFHTDRTKKGMLSILRNRLSEQMGVWLEQRQKEYNKINLSFDDIQILEDSFNQLRGGLKYHKNNDGSFSVNDIKHRHHPYYGWTSENLYHFCRENMIICRWTQMKEIDKEGHIKHLVKLHCDGDSTKRNGVKKKLQRLLNRGNEESQKWSEWGLSVIVEGVD